MTKMAAINAPASRLEMKNALRLLCRSMSASTRLCHALTKSTPLISGRRSTMSGGRPTGKNLSRSMKQDYS
jgi:hypothetical protein